MGPASQNSVGDSGCLSLTRATTMEKFVWSIESQSRVLVSNQKISFNSWLTSKIGCFFNTKTSAGFMHVLFLDTWMSNNCY